MIARVYGAISAVAAALSREGIAKQRLNTRDDYLYRSIDDVLARLSPLLAEHRLCILPQALERTASERTGENGELLVSVTVRCAFTLVSAEDGSAHVIETYGEALDPGDRGTAKAMQSAYKYALLQAFCVPVPPAEDADARSYRLTRPAVAPAPGEGWPQWGEALEAALAACSTLEEMAALQDELRPLLAALAREEPELYQRIGLVLAARRAKLSAGATQREAGACPSPAAAAARPCPAPSPAPPAKPRRSRAARQLNAGTSHA